MAENEESPRSRRGSVGLWLAIGAVFGIALGAGMSVVTRNPRIWLGAGIAVGVAVGLAIGLVGRKSDR